MPLSYKKQPLSRYLANNPIRFNLSTDSQDMVEMEFSPTGLSNLMNPDTFSFNKKISSDASSIGDLVDDNGYDTSDYIRIEDGAAYKFLTKSGQNSIMGNISIYQEDKTHFVGWHDVDISVAISNVAYSPFARYFRISFKKDSSNYKPSECGVFYNTESTWSAYGERYTGQYFPVGTFSDYWVDISVDDIIKPYLSDYNIVSPDSLISSSVFSFLEIGVRFRQGNTLLEYTGKIYNGGISKRFQRYLLEKNTEIFTYKLQNSDKQFALTTRTDSRHITMRESEICPLFFIAKNGAYTIETERGWIFTVPTLTEGNVYSLNIDHMRKFCTGTRNELPALFNVKVDGKVIFDITIIPTASVPYIYIIEFLNSYGVPERLEVSGKKTSEPEFGEENAFDRYNSDIDDYVEQNDRLPLREVINAEFGYKTLEEFLFARDMLQSNKRYLIDPSGKRHEVRVKSESFSHDLHPITPGNVSFEIRFVDLETEFSPVPDESVIESEIPNNVIVSRSGIPFVAKSGNYIVTN